MAQKFTVPITVKQLASAGSDAVTVYVDADTQARLKIEAGGRLTWGSGASAGDVNLYRSAADTLSSDDTLKVPTLFVDNIEVDTTGATTNQVLKFNGTKFVPGTASTVGSIDDLSDVVITSPEAFQTLEYNGTNWVNTYSSVVSYVRNAEATTLTTGTAVYLFGATGDHATVKRADNNSDATSSKTIGLVGANITASNNGPVVTRGYVDGINLSVGYTAGDILWLGENGAFTKTKPTAPDHLVFIGVVVRATNNGIVYVATQNGYELDELHNVSIPSPNPGDFLKYDGSLWVNDQINLGTDTVGNYVSSVTAGTGISVNFAPGEGVGASVSLNATLDNLSDVSVATPTGGYVLTYDDIGLNWVAAAVQPPAKLDDIGDVKAGSPSGGDLLKYDGGTSEWKNGTLALDELNNVVAPSPAYTNPLIWNGTEWASGSQELTLGVPGTTDYLTISTTSGVSNSTLAGENFTVGPSGLVATDGTGGPYVNLNANNVTFSNGTDSFMIDPYWATSGQVLAFTPGAGSSGTWGPTTPTLDFLSDVSAASPSAGNVLTYNGSAWTAASAASGGASLEVSATAPASPEVGDLWFNSATLETYIYYDSHWLQASGEPDLVEDLTDLSDVTLTTPVNGQFLKFDGTRWVNGTIPTINTLDDIGDVSVPSPSSGQFLKWNGTAWVAETIIGGATISDTAPASPLAGQLWFQSTNGKTFVYYDSSWIEVGGVGTGARMVSSSSAPASPLEGSMWFDTDTAQTFVYYDSQWIEIGASGVTASVQDSAPAAPVSGQIWFNSLTGGTYVYYGTNWIEVGASPFSALVNTINAKGDLLVGTADNTIGGLTAGSANQVLTVDSSTATGLKWATPVSTGKAIAMSIVFGG